MTISTSLFGNWTENGWNLRLRGFVYRPLRLSTWTIEKLTSTILLSSVTKLSPSAYARAVKLTREVFVAPQRGVSVSFKVAPWLVGGRAEQDSIDAQVIGLPGTTTLEGDIDEFMPVGNFSGTLLPGSETNHLQPVLVNAHQVNTATVTSYLVPPTGITIICDIDDVLRVSRIWHPFEVFHNLFHRPFKPWLNMPQTLADWSRRVPGIHWHYLTVTPEQLVRPYMGFVRETYPMGTFDARIINITNPSGSWEARRFLLDKIFQSFPQRKFILIGDTTNRDLMKDYPGMVTRYPGQVQCILLRNTSATDSTTFIPYNTKHFRDIPQEQYMFFRVPVRYYPCSSILPAFNRPLPQSWIHSV